MKLYTNSLTANGRKVHIVADHLGLSLDKVEMKLFEGQTHTPEFLAINPNGKIPVLVDGDTTLWESNAIMAYLASRIDNTLWPKSDERYHIMQWMNWEAAHFQPCSSQLISERMLKKVLDVGEPDAAIIEQAEVDFRRYGAILNSSLEGKAFLRGADPTLADISIAVFFAYAEPAQYPMAELKEIHRWYRAMCELPAFKQNLPPASQ
ncbi:MAG: glutathione S-transferase family protein [Proteobacteria bacterium]|nr:glutathione S-transferase family protein [Pseudomonadota bacterium]